MPSVLRRASFAEPAECPALTVPVPVPGEVLVPRVMRLADARRTSRR